MYSHTRKGTKHKVDVASKNHVIKNALLPTKHGKPLSVHIDLINLGGKDSAYTMRSYTNCITENGISAFGIALTPQANVNEFSSKPLYLEVTYACNVNVIPFVGYFDNDSLVVGRNPVTNYHILPSINNQAILLQNINSSSFHYEKLLCVGLLTINNKEKNIIASLSARYARQKIVTQDLSKV